MWSFSFRVLEFGIFDSNVKFPKTGKTSNRLVEVFELEFFTADCPGQAYINDVVYPMQCGVFLCGKPGQLRRSRLPFRCNYVHLETEDPALRALLFRLPDAGVLPRMSEVTRIYQELLAEESDPAAFRLVLQSCVCRLIGILAQQSSPLAGGAHRECLLEAGDYIQDHIADDLSLAALAARANLSPIYFHKLFMRHYGKTPAQYILERRISAAKIGLLNESGDLAALAADCGFSSQAYFSYKFKQVTGRSPLQYRKEMLSRMEP